MLARKSQLQNNKPAGLTTMERSRLNQARTLAQRRQDYAEVAEIDAQLAELAATTTERHNPREDDVDLLAKVNERNRKANLEAIRKAETVDAERKRKERKLAAAGGVPTSNDPSARLKILPRLFNAATPTTRFVLPATIFLFFICSSLAHQLVLSLSYRPGTPNLVGTPVPQSNSPSRPASPPPPLANLNGNTKTFEASVIDSIEVDLGDF